MHVRSRLALSVTLAFGVAAAALAGDEPRKKGPPASRAEARALKVVARAVSAAGGRDAFGRIHDFRITGTEVLAAAKDERLDLELVWREPGLWRETLKWKGEVQFAYGNDGKTGWTMNMGQVFDDPYSVGRLAVLQAGRADLLAASAASGEIELRDAGKATAEGKTWRVIEARRPPATSPIRYHFDIETGLLGRVELEARRERSLGTEYRIVTLEDYRKVGDVLWPHAITESRVNRILQGWLEKRTIQNVELNVGLEPGAFTRPAGAPAARRERHLVPPPAPSAAPDSTPSPEVQP